MVESDLTAGAAAAELGVSVPTLYAYVSRGLVRSQAVPNSRERRYRLEDVRALKQRKQLRRDPDKAVEEALHWGLPVLESEISLITSGRLYYRGNDVIDLAQQRTFEEVVGLLWSGELGASPGTEPAANIPPVQWSRVLRLVELLGPLKAFQVALPLAASFDSAAYDLREASVRRAGASILSLLTGLVVRRRPAQSPVASVLQKAWAPRAKDVAALLDAALILYADNGLSPSTFTARCVASAGSTPYAVVTAGLAALQGSKHGGACERAEALLREAERPQEARRAVADRLRRGEGMPGFGHPRYPDGDPRGGLLLELAARHRPRSPVVLLASTLVDAVRDLMGHGPNVDFGVVTLCRALGLPPTAPLSLLALGRTAGWIAHALEQYREGRVIRPRARYAGELPRS